jgi:DNA-directed RNA polymerase subunit RPC12/RpoP
MKMNESSIINALYEARKTANEEATPAGDAAVGGPKNGGMNIYCQCPECKEIFAIDANEGYEEGDLVECPYCGAEVDPDFIDTLYDESKNECDDKSAKSEGCNESAKSEGCDDPDDKKDDDTDEAVKTVKAHTEYHGGKKVKIKAHKVKKLKGKALMARRKAIKKAQRKAHTGTADKKRSRSMRKRSAQESMSIDDNILKEMINNIVSDVISTCNESLNRNYCPFEVTNLSNATYNESTDTFKVDGTVNYEDDKVTEAQFVIEGLASGNFTMSESNGIFNCDGLTITGKSSISDNNIDISEMTYRLDSDGNFFTESYEVAD